MSGQQYLFDDLEHVERIKFEARSLIAEGASPVSVVGGTLWAAAMVAQANDMDANRFMRLVHAMVLNVIEHNAPGCEADAEDEDDEVPEAGAWGDA